MTKYIVKFEDKALQDIRKITKSGNKSDKNKPIFFSSLQKPQNHCNL